MKTWRILLAVFLIFAAGGVTGGLIVRRIAPAAKVEKRGPSMPPHSDHRKSYLDRLDSKLSLTAAQRQEVDRILKEGQERMKQLWEGIEPQAKDEYRRTRKEISEILTPEQNEVYKTMRKDRDKGGDKGKSDKDGNKGPSALFDSGCRCC